MKQGFSCCSPKFANNSCRVATMCFKESPQCFLLFPFIQRAPTEQANIHSAHSNRCKLLFTCMHSVMTSCDNCIPTCHEYLAKVTRPSLPGGKGWQARLSARQVWRPSIRRCLKIFGTTVLPTLSHLLGNIVVGHLQESPLKHQFAVFCSWEWVHHQHISIPPHRRAKAYCLYFAQFNTLYII